LREKKHLVKLKFWGARGSVPTPGYKYIKYGGNTACVEIRFDDELVIIDAGTGIRELGLELAKEAGIKKKPVKCNILISHTHWDHIHGFPFFVPAYIPGSEINIYGGHTVSGLEDLLNGQMEKEYFPVGMGELAAKINVFTLEDNPFILNDKIIIKWVHLFHPGLCLGFRLEYKSKVIVYATDTELFQSPEMANVNIENMLKFIHNADILIFDGQYTIKEYLLNKVGWGHSAIEEVVELALKGGVKHLFTFHHDPLHDDDFIEKTITNVNVHQDKGLFVSAAREGLEIVL
jgi:phosphoribosyl 1,2-cyclic phosphodiesterase